MRKNRKNIKFLLKYKTVVLLVVAPSDPNAAVSRGIASKIPPNLVKSLQSIADMTSMLEVLLCEVLYFMVWIIVME